MSLDFTAIFAFGRADHGIESLRDELAREPGGLREAIAHYRAWWRVQEWTIETPNGEMAELLGPGGFALTISARAVSVYHLLSFSRFTGVEEARGLVRRACFAIASILESPRALYMHELLPNGFHAGQSLDEIEATLRADFGPPSPTFAALDEAEHFGRGCWYIDGFDDLRT